MEKVILMKEQEEKLKAYYIKQGKNATDIHLPKVDRTFSNGYENGIYTTLSVLGIKIEGINK